jgi:hypothetical protein
MSDLPRLVQIARSQYHGVQGEKISHMYYDLLDKIQKSFRKKDVRSLLNYCSLSLPLLELFVNYWKKQPGGFGIQSIPAIELGCRFFAITGARGQLLNIQALVDYVAELRSWEEVVDNAFGMLNVANTIREHVAANPGFKQNKLKSALGYPNARELSYIVRDMQDAGILERKKSGNTYELYAQ